MNWRGRVWVLNGTGVAKVFAEAGGAIVVGETKRDRCTSQKREGHYKL